MEDHLDPVSAVNRVKIVNHNNNNKSLMPAR